MFHQFLTQNFHIWDVSVLVELGIFDRLAIYDMEPFLRGRIAPVVAITQNRINLLNI